MRQHKGAGRRVECGFEREMDTAEIDACVFRKGVVAQQKEAGEGDSGKDDCIAQRDEWRRRGRGAGCGMLGQDKPRKYMLRRREHEV